VVATAALAVSKLAAGTNGQILTTTAGVPTWGSSATTDLGGQYLASGSSTSNITISGTTQAGATNLATSTSFSADGVIAVRVEWSIPRLETNNTTDADLFVHLFEDATVLAQVGTLIRSTVQKSLSVSGFFRYVPSNGSHTLSLKAHRNVANGTAYAGSGTAGAMAPILLLVTRDAS